MCVITTAFEAAARARARVLGTEDHPTVVMQHPLASRSAAEVVVIAGQLVGAIASALTVPA